MIGFDGGGRPEYLNMKKCYWTPVIAECSREEDSIVASTLGVL